MKPSKPRFHSLFLGVFLSLAALGYAQEELPDPPQPPAEETNPPAEEREAPEETPKPEPEGEPGGEQPEKPEGEGDDKKGEDTPDGEGGRT